MGPFCCVNRPQDPEEIQIKDGGEGVEARRRRRRGEGRRVGGRGRKGKDKEVTFWK